MAQVLNLSDGQTVKLQGVLQNEYEQLVALREDASMSREDKQAKLTVIRQNAAGQVMSILTPEQQKRLVQLLNEQDDEQAAPPQPGTQPPPVRH